jgi:thiol:disulfide interchange protein
MDGTESRPAPRPASRADLSTVLLWAAAAVVVLRIATAIFAPLEERPEGPVSWQPRERAAALSRASGKPILYDFTAAWCGPCRLLDADWHDAAIAQTINEGFVPSRVQDRQREDGKNPDDVAELQRRYEIEGFPTLVAAAPDGRLIGKLVGYRGRDALVKFLEEARK